MLISIKRGAWFERADERGWTRFAESHLCRNLKYRFAELGVHSLTLFSEVGVDRIRVALFFPEKIAELISRIVTDELSGPTFESEHIQRDARTFRREWSEALKDPLCVAQRALSLLLPKPNHEVLASREHLRRTRLPTPASLRAFWLRLFHSARVDVRLFGPWPTGAKRIMARLKRSPRGEYPTWAVSSAREVRLPSLRGIVWRESCFHPMYALLDTLMTLRARRARLLILRYDRGAWRGYAVFGKRTDRFESVCGPISEREWQQARRAMILFLERIRRSPQEREYVFYDDDFDRWSYGPFGIRSFDDFALAIESGSYADFLKYVERTIGRVAPWMSPVE